VMARLRDLVVQPRVVELDQPVTVVVHLQCPAFPDPREFEVTCSGHPSGWDPEPLTPRSALGSALIFSRTFKAAFYPTGGRAYVRARIGRRPHDLVMGCSERSAPLDIVRSPKEAAQRSDALAAEPPEAKVPAFEKLRLSRSLETDLCAMDARAHPADPVKALAYADALMREGQPRKAAEELRRVLQLQPERWTIQSDLGCALLRLPDSAEAAHGYLDRALRRAEDEMSRRGPWSDDPSRCWHRFGILLCRKAAESAEGPTRDAALARACEALCRAVILRREEARKEAVRPHEDARARHRTRPAYSLLYDDYLLARCLAAAHRHPDDYLAHFGVAQALLGLAQPDLAAAPLARVRLLKPEFSELLYAEGLMAWQAGDEDRAVAALSALLKRNPRHPYANRLLADIHAHAGRMPQALAAWDAFARVYGEDCRDETPWDRQDD